MEHLTKKEMRDLMIKTIPTITDCKMTLQVVQLLFANHFEDIDNVLIQVDHVGYVFILKNGRAFTVATRENVLSIGMHSVDTDGVINTDELVTQMYIYLDTIPHIKYIAELLK